MRVKSERRRIGIHVKGVGRESRNIWADQFTAKRQHETIVGQEFLSSRRCDGYLLFCDVDRLHLSGQMSDTNRIEQFAERDGDVAEIVLVIPDSDVMIGVAVEE